jgi:hypothetical protein
VPGAPHRSWRPGSTSSCPDRGRLLQVEIFHPGAATIRSPRRGWRCCGPACFIRFAANREAEVGALEGRSERAGEPPLHANAPTTQSGHDIGRLDPVQHVVEAERVVVRHLALLDPAEHRRQIVLAIQPPVRIARIGRLHRTVGFSPRQKLPLEVLVGRSARSARPATHRPFTSRSCAVWKLRSTRPSLAASKPCWPRSATRQARPICVKAGCFISAPSTRGRAL